MLFTSVIPKDYHSPKIAFFVKTYIISKVYINQNIYKLLSFTLLTNVIVRLLRPFLPEISISLIKLVIDRMPDMLKTTF